MSRYEAGMKYGAHADVAFMTVHAPGGSTQLRSDLSCTIFLNDPRSYEGGELVLHLGSLPAGSHSRACPAKPSSIPRLAARSAAGDLRDATGPNTFIESLIPDERERNLLFEIQDVLALEGLKMDWTSRVRLEVATQISPACGRGTRFKPERNRGWPGWGWRCRTMVRRKSACPA